MNKQIQKAPLLHLPRSNKIDIEFENITFTVSHGRKEKQQILKNISGKFKSGELTAIMGPSGAGKTSLLNILTGFQCAGMKGLIKSNGAAQKKVGSAQYKKESCYILQDDQLIPFFTVIELMYMASNLKLGRNVSEKTKELIIDDILGTLGLNSCKDTRCGTLSGGQRKRLSIALELVNNPPIMFLDEPTTGLDSSSSLQCITMLKSLAKGGRTIICTIHQPSATIYEMFDYVYVMADGCCIYQGASKNTVAYLSSVGLECPEYHNPADYLLEVANGEYGNCTEELSEAAKKVHWRNVYTPSYLEIEEERSVQNHNTQTHRNSNVDVEFNNPSEWTKFAILINRSFLQITRNWVVTYVKLVLHIAVGILIGLFYLNSGNDASKTISNFSYIMVTCCYLCYTSMMPAILQFPSEIPVLRKERFNNWYKLKTYYVAFLLVDIPVQILFCGFYTSISYFMSAQPMESTRFFMFFVVCCLLTIAAESIGILLGTIVNPVNGTFLGAISFALMLVLAGFLVFLTHMSKPFLILSYISYIRYALEGMVYSIYGQKRGIIPCPEEILYCHYTTPSVFLKEIGMANVDYWFNTLMLGAFIILLKLVTYCTLRRKLSHS